MAERLAPARPPIRLSDEDSVETAKSLSDIAGEIAPATPQSEEEAMFAKAARVFPALEPEIEDDWDEEVDPSDFAQFSPDIRRPVKPLQRSLLGGETLVRDEPEGGPPLMEHDGEEEETLSRRGPPGGGRLIRDAPEMDGPAHERTQLEDELEAEEVHILKPVRRPVLQPKAAAEAALQPVKTSVLTPVGERVEKKVVRMATLTPVTSTDTAVQSMDEEEE